MEIGYVLNLAAGSTTTQRMRSATSVVVEHNWRDHSEHAIIGDAMDAEMGMPVDSHISPLTKLKGRT